MINRVESLLQVNKDKTSVFSFIYIQVPIIVECNVECNRDDMIDDFLLG